MRRKKNLNPTIEEHLQAYEKAKKERFIKAIDFDSYIEVPDFYSKIIKHFGCDNQCVVAIEELSELQKEICKHLRGLGNVHHIAEEIADVQIMLEQLQRIFDCHSEVELIKKQKIQRTTERYLKK